MLKTNGKDPNFKNPGSVKLKVQLFSTNNYFGQTYVEVIDRAEKLLAEHGLGIHCFPSKNPAPLIDLEGKGPKGVFWEGDYPIIKARIDEVMGLTRTAQTHLAVVFCTFNESGHGVTPWKKYDWKKPLTLISSRPNDDRVTLLHEMGHAALLDHSHVEHEGALNIMDEGEGRTVIFRDQVEALAKCFFAS